MDIMEKFNLDSGQIVRNYDKEQTNMWVMIKNL